MNNLHKGNRNSGPIFKGKTSLLTSLQGSRAAASSLDEKKRTFGF